MMTTTWPNWHMSLMISFWIIFMKSWSEMCFICLRNPATGLYQKGDDRCGNGQNILSNVQADQTSALPKASAALSFDSRNQHRDR